MSCATVEATQQQQQGGMKVIATHGSTFHLDDALAVFMLRCLPELQGARVVRGATAPADAAVVVDVGGEYDASRRRYDHHQRGFCEMELPGVTLAAAGLVWRHHGRDVLRALWPPSAADSCTRENVEVLHRRVYAAFVAAVDAGDNGIDPYPCARGMQPLYEDRTTLAHRIKTLNGRWNEDERSNADTRFERASALAGAELRDCIEWNVLGWLPARRVVEAAFADRRSVHLSGRVIAFPRGSRAPPYRDHLYELEAAERERDPAAAAQTVLYAIVWDGGRNQWAATAVGPNGTSFACRLAFPPAWRGLRDAELVAATGVENAVFVHASGFLACNTDFDCIVRMIDLSMQLQPEALAAATTSPSS